MRKPEKTDIIVSLTMLLVIIITITLNYYMISLIEKETYKEIFFPLLYPFRYMLGTWLIMIFLMLFKYDWYKRILFYD